MILQKHERLALDALREELPGWNLEVCSGRRHRPVWATGPGGHRYKFVLSTSPTNADNMIKGLRRQARTVLKGSTSK